MFKVITPFDIEPSRRRRWRKEWFYTSYGDVCHGEQMAKVWPTKTISGTVGFRMARKSCFQGRVAGHFVKKEWS